MPHGRNRFREIHDGRAIAFPGWLEVPGLLHGTTTRAALPEPGKKDLFDAVEALRVSGVLPRRLTLGGDQVHGDAVAVMDAPISFGGHPAGFRWNVQDQIGEYAATDALVTNIPGVILVIQTADCLPVLLIDRSTRVAGVAHCGWKGTLAGLAAKTARMMMDLGAGVGRMEAWIGPGICARDYEVSGDLVRQFQQSYPAEVVSSDRRHLDLTAVVRWQLEEAGLLAEHVLDSAECTREKPERYYSYRGEGAATGRLVSFVGFGPEAE